MTATNKKIINTLLAIDIGILIFCILSGHRNWLYSTQIGFFSSALVIAGSMMSYRRMVEKRLAQNMVPMDNERDTLDKIDDPHDLYTEEIVNEDRELSKEEFADVVKKEKAKLKENRRSITEVAKDSRASLTFYRIGAYVLLVLGFFYLNRHEYLHIPSYIFALSVPPVIVVVILMQENRRTQNRESDKIST